MTYYFRKAIELAIATPNSIVWASNPIKALAVAYTYTNNSLLEIHVHAKTMVVYHARSTGKQRLTQIDRSNDKAFDLRMALHYAILDN